MAPSTDFGTFGSFTNNQRGGKMRFSSSKVLRMLFSSFLLLATSQVVLAEDLAFSLRHRNTSLVFTPPTSARESKSWWSTKNGRPCHSTAALVITRSSHPEGNPNGLLNEDNGGVGGRCYLDSKRHYYLAIQGLVNSHRGDTFAFGVGTRWRLFKLYGLYTEAGGELLLVDYARPERRLFLSANPSRGLMTPKIVAIKKRGNIRGLLPLPHLAVGYDFGRYGELSLMQMHLPAGAARLRAVVVDDDTVNDWNATPEQRGNGLSSGGTFLLFRYRF